MTLFSGVFPVNLAQSDAVLDSVASWSNPTNVYSDDGSYAFIQSFEGLREDRLDWLACYFDESDIQSKIASDDTLRGIEIVLKDILDVVTFEFDPAYGIRYETKVASTIKASGDIEYFWEETDQTYTIGASGNKLGCNASDVRSSDFAVRFRPGNILDGEARIDQLYIALFWESGSVADSANSNTPLFIEGHIISSGDTTLFLHGHDTTSGDVTLYTFNSEVVSGEIPLYTSGEWPNEQITLFVEGMITNSGDITLYTNGHESLNNISTLYLKAPEEKSEVITLYTDGHTAISNNIILFMYGVIADEESNLPLTVIGPQPMSGYQSLNLFTFGANVSGMFGGLELSLFGVYPSALMNLYVAGSGPPISGQMVLFLDGLLKSSNANTELVIWNEYNNPSGFVNLYVKGSGITAGYVPVDTYLNLFIKRHPSEAITLFLQGPPNTLDSGVIAYVEGCITESNTLTLSIPEVMGGLDQALKMYARGF